MRLLDRFLLRELLIPWGFTFFGFLLFWVVFDLTNKTSEFQSKHLLAADIAEIYWLQLPELLTVVLPVSFLLGLLYTLASHARHHEIIAMRAAGISLWRICVPYFAVGLCFTGALFWTSEHLSPNAADRVEAIMGRRMPQGTDSRIVQNLNFRNARDNRIWNIGSFDPRTSEMTNPHIEWRLPDGSRRTLLARSGFYTNNAWHFSQVQQLASGPPGSTNYYAPVRAPLIVVGEWTETPADIRLQIRFSKLNAALASKRPHLSLAEIEYLQTHLELNRRDSAILATQWHARLAQPWICVVVALVAIPFGAASGRRNVFLGVAASIFLCFGYFILQRLGLALASGGFIPAAVGAWIPNGAFAATGLWLTNRVK